MADMMAVNLRIDTSSDLKPRSEAYIVGVSISDLISIRIPREKANDTDTSVWHPVCPKHGCEGLRVLETWVKPGWGLGTSEIGRTGIFSPRND